MNKQQNDKAACYGGGQVPDYNMHRLGELLPGVLEAGKRQEGSDRKPGGRLWPTNSERMNRALKELGKSAFKVHTLLWKWRGAPARGKLPFFTVRSLSKFCSLTRPTVRSALRELVGKGWIQKLGYSCHKKNELYRLVPIRDVESSVVQSPPLAPPGNPPDQGGRSLVRDVC